MLFKKHPKELFILALAELCERYTFWGIGNLLVLYLIDYYKASTETAAHTYGIFTGCAVFLPLVGGYIADRWNYHHPLLLGALINAIGCFLIAAGNPTLLHIALGIIAIGYGIFTPSILTLLGFTYRDKADLREAGFSIYYAAINVGVFLAMITLGYIGQSFGWHYAFIFAGCVQLSGFIPLTWYIRKHHVKYKDLHPRMMKKTEGIRPPITKEQKDRIIVIMTLIFFSIVFWMPYSQGFSSMSIFAQNFTNRNLLNFEIPAAWILSSESLFLIILAPILASFYGYLQKIKKDPSPPIKTALSLFSMALCFAIMVFGSRLIPPNAKAAGINFLFPIVAYFFMAIGEMLLAPVGLSMVATLAPRRFTALLMGAWYAFVGISFYLGGLFAGLIEKIPTMYDFFSILVFVAAIPGVFLLMLSKMLNRKSHKDWKPE